MNRIISTILAALTAVGIIGWIVYQNMVPSGVFEAHWRPGEPSALIGPLVPESRLLPLMIAEDGTPYQSIVEEPLNFDVRMPQSFALANVRVTYAGDPAIVEIGGLASRESWTFDLRPASNTIIDALRWKKVFGDGLVLHERTPRFKSVKEFLANVPPAGVATYRADLSSKIQIPGYVPSTVARSYQTAFRGTTSIKVFLRNEPLDFTFVVQDVNRHTGADPLAVTATQEGVEVGRVELADDGNDGADGALSALRSVHLQSDGPLSGTVRVNLGAGDDIVVRELKTTAQKFVFANRFYAADSVGYAAKPAPVSLVTNGRRLAVTTAHPEGFQVIQAGAHAITIDDVNTRFTISTADDIRRNGVINIIAPAADVRLETAGVFALTRDTFWNPDPAPVTWETDVDKDGIDYLLTSYVPPHREGVWKTATAIFDVRGLSLLNRATNFTISAPGIELQQKELRIARIDVMFVRPSLQVKDLWPALRKLWDAAVGTQPEFVNHLKP
jgi:hypothetical protein